MVLHNTVLNSIVIFKKFLNTKLSFIYINTMAKNIGEKEARNERLKR